MQSYRRKANNKCVSSCITILTAALFLPAQASQNKTHNRIVFPHDIVRFPCTKPSGIDQQKLGSPVKCTWRFLSQNSNDSWTEVTNDCTKTTDTKHKLVPSAEANDGYEGYLEVPENATAILCEPNNGIDMEQPLVVQNVRVVSPLSSYSNSGAKIILQRFSDDFGIRFAAHDVTDQEITLNGTEVSSFKLLCIHTTKVSWKKVTSSHQRVFDELHHRDSKWLRSKTGELEKKWEAYLQFLTQFELNTVGNYQVENLEDRVTYMASLVIHNVTNMTARTYECMDIQEHKVISHVSMRIDDPRVIGPDEIHMIEQILSILDSMAQGKGTGREPWYTLGSLMSIILILFMYYCKKKLDQPPVPPPPKVIYAGTAETEERIRLQKSAAQPEPQEGHGAHDSPVSVVVEQG